MKTDLNEKETKNDGKKSKALTYTIHRNVSFFIADLFMFIAIFEVFYRDLGVVESTNPFFVISLIAFVLSLIFGFLEKKEKK